MTSSPGFVRQPEAHGCMERFFRTRKEQLLWVRHSNLRGLNTVRAAVLRTLHLIKDLP
jgi:hypothetical protein